VKKKSSCERLLDSQNSIPKKEFVWKGFVIAEIPLWKKIREKRLCDSRDSFVKEKFEKRGFVIAEIPLKKKKILCKASW
jgi:hypothetical protein